MTTNAVLTQNLSCPGTDGIVVGASRITVDLKGFTLRGDRSLFHYGINDNGFDEVTLKNGVVRNFHRGASALADQVSVLNVLASGNIAEGIVVLGDLAKVRSSTASGNGDVGIVVSGASAKVQSSSASGNAQRGITLQGPAALTQSSTASGNAGNGIFVAGASAQIKSSKASGNSTYGIVISGDAAQLTGNRAEGNGFEGGTSNLVGLGIWVTGYTTAPVGTNVSRGNDDPQECVPALLC